MPAPTQEACKDHDKTKVTVSTRPEWSDMPQMSRAAIVLPLLAAHDLPLKPKAIYGGLIEHNEITFSYKQLRDTIGELHEAGYLRRVEIDTDSYPSEIRDIP